MVFRFCKNQALLVQNLCTISATRDTLFCFLDVVSTQFSLIIEQVSTVPYQLGKLTRLNSVSLAVAPAAAEERAAPSSWKFV